VVTVMLVTVMAVTVMSMVTVASNLVTPAAPAQKNAGVTKAGGDGDVGDGGGR